jgi:phosphomevalonate kinase
MEVTAKAPGKLVLLGEYAVLEGAPAMVMGVNRYARVRIVALAGGECAVSSPDLGLKNIPMRVAAGGLPDWQGSAENAAKLRLVDQVLRGLAHESLAPAEGRGFSLHLDTADFFEAGAALPTKLGLGSSAALTVALASALAVFVGRGAATASRRVWLEQLLHLHRQFQGGQGSGVDVAASLIGGLISYRLGEQGTQPRFQAASWPEGVHPLFIWSGRPASTADFLGRLAQWRSGHGGEYAAHMEALTAIAERASAAAAAGQGRQFVESAAAYAGALKVFGAACGLPIFSPEHERLGALAAESGVIYKPCGAGGGDFGVVFALEPERRADVERRITGTGFRCVPLAVDEHGLVLEYKGF